jgi:hypothetical protein
MPPDPTWQPLHLISCLHQLSCSIPFLDWPAGMHSCLSLSPTLPVHRRHPSPSLHRHHTSASRRFSLPRERRRTTSHPVVPPSVVWQRQRRAGEESTVAPPPLLEHQHPPLFSDFSHGDGGNQSMDWSPLTLRPPPESPEFSCPSAATPPSLLALP